jgi:hypothetical protein
MHIRCPLESLRGLDSKDLEPPIIGHGGLEGRVDPLTPEGRAEGLLPPGTLTVLLGSQFDPSPLATRERCVAEILDPSRGRASMSR